MRISLLAFVLLAPSLVLAQPPANAPDAGAAHPAAPNSEPRYLAAMRDELTGMRVRGAQCEATDAARSQCTFTARGITTGRDFEIHLVYSDHTDTIYVYVQRYLVVPPNEQTTPAVLRRLMELNWTLLLGKFEWDSTSGEVRLAMVLNTDSNFDRRAFRSAVRGIGQLADRYYRELDRMVRGQAPR
jgi:hypothetical protein